MKSYAIATLESPADEDFFARVREVVDAEVDFLQLRTTSLPARPFAEAASACAEIVPGSKTSLLIGRRADIAAAVGAAGVHLPAAGMPVAAVRAIRSDFLVGRSTHSLEGCQAASVEGADYVFLGPVFAPRSKAGDARISDQEIRLAAAIGIPIFVLGGISLQNMSRFRELPVAGIAGITLFMRDRPLQTIMEAVRAL